MNNARCCFVWVAALLVHALGAVVVGQDSAPKPGAARVFAHGAVAADHPVASEAGAKMLRLGGNAVDAAVATSFALSVVRPESCGIGGGGFMVVCLPDDPTHGRVVTAINYRETAPGGATPDMFETTDLPDASTRSGLAVAVPGTVAGLLYALEQYGTLDRATVLQPAIDAAVGGYEADATFAGSVRTAMRRLGDQPSVTDRAIWSDVLGRGEIRAGEIVRNLNQASVLAAIAANGADGFYRGRVARQIVQTAADRGGVLSLGDLAGYEVAEVRPLEYGFGEWTFLGMPPPSSGGVTIAETLGILERVRSDDLVGDTGEHPSLARARSAHLLIESLKHAFADRSAWLADPAFVEVPVGMLLDGGYLDARAAMVDRSRTLAPMSYGTRPEGDGARALPDDSGTSHLSVVDQWGGAVACTETINLTFGSMIAVEGAGFCLNNEMDDFTTVRGRANAFGLVQSDSNLPEPGKRPLSSMSPTVVLGEDGRVVAVAGGSGGPRIITGTLQVLLNALTEGMDAGEAVSAPRLHHQWSPDAVRVEPGLYVDGVDEDSAAANALFLAGLAVRGHRVERIDTVGVVQLIVRDAEGVHAASDPRKGGRPAGH